MRVSRFSLSLSFSLPPLFLSSFTVTTHRPRLRTDSSTFLRVFVPFQVSGTRCEVNLENNRSKEIRGRLSSASNVQPRGTATACSREADEHRNACYQFPYAVARVLVSRQAAPRREEETLRCRERDTGRINHLFQKESSRVSSTFPLQREEKRAQRTKHDKVQRYRYRGKRRRSLDFDARISRNRARKNREAIMGTRSAIASSP